MYSKFLGIEFNNLTNTFRIAIYLFAIGSGNMNFVENLFLRVISCGALWSETWTLTD